MVWTIGWATDLYSQLDNGLVSRESKVVKGLKTMCGWTMGKLESQKSSEDLRQLGLTDEPWALWVWAGLWHYGFWLICLVPAIPFGLIGFLIGLLSSRKSSKDLRH